METWATEARTGQPAGDNNYYPETVANASFISPHNHDIIPEPTMKYDCVNPINGNHSNTLNFTQVIKTENDVKKLNTSISTNLAYSGPGLLHGKGQLPP